MLPLGLLEHVREGVRIVAVGTHGVTEEDILVLILDGRGAAIGIHLVIGVLGRAPSVLNVRLALSLRCLCSFRHVRL